MKIGKPRKIHRVEPLRSPVPTKTEPLEAPLRRAPEPVRTK